MLQHVLDQPWIFLGVLLVIVVLWLAATLRVGHDRRLKQRALLDRRKAMRPGSDRRWHARPRY